jgi:selenocysteine lyase/cysteine desulfurase
MLSVPVRGDRAKIAAALDAAKVRVSHGQDAVRVSFHLYNGPDEVDRAADVLSAFCDRT